MVIAFKTSSASSLSAKLLFMFSPGITSQNKTTTKKFTTQLRPAIYCESESYRRIALITK